MTIQDRARQILALAEKSTEKNWNWDGLKITPKSDDEPRDFIWVPQGSYLGDTMITLGDTYEGSGEDCLFVSESMKAIVEFAQYILKQETTDTKDSPK